MGRTKHDLICQGCGGTYQNVNPKHMFCSSSCASKFHAKDHRRTYTYTCHYCGKNYIPKSKERDKYCSRECYFAEKRVNKLNRPIKVKRKPVCIICGIEFNGSLRKHYCSEECFREDKRRKAKERDKYQYKSKVFKCKECGKSATTEYGDKHSVFCSIKCNELYSLKKFKEYKLKHPEIREISQYKRRSKIKEVKIESVKPMYIFNRDKWICGICHKHVNKKLKHPNLMSPSLDHIIPIAQGGLHTNNNCQLAHLVCNSKKGMKCQGQMLMIG